MRWLVVSVAIHAVVGWWLWTAREVATAQRAHAVATTRWLSPQPASGTQIDNELAIEVQLDASGSSAGGTGAASAGRATAGAATARSAAVTRRARADDPWEHVTVSHEARGDTAAAAAPGAAATATASTAGAGTGSGTGIGFGEGGGIEPSRDVPAPPPAPRVSQARPARLVWPTRDAHVEDDDLFVARVTVDGDGAVVGVRMLKTRPGARGDDAANAIWTFRYRPALDEHGVPVRSTFEQPFMVR